MISEKKFMRLSRLFATLLVLFCLSFFPFGCGDTKGSFFSDSLHLSPTATLSESLRNMGATSDQPTESISSNVESSIQDIFENSSSPEEAIDTIEEIFRQNLNTPEAFNNYVQASRSLGGRIFDYESVSAQTASPPLQTHIHTKAEGVCEGGDLSEVVVIFVNGMAVDYATYTMNLNTLKARLVGLSEVSIGGMYQTSARDPEISEFGGEICPLFSPLWGLYADEAKSICQSLGGFTVDLGEVFVQGSQEVIDRFGEWGSTPVVGVGQTSQLVQLISQAVESGRKVVLISHSQGNYFVRDAINSLHDPNRGNLNPSHSIGVIMLGSPVSLNTMGANIGSSHVRKLQNNEDLIAQIGDPNCANQFCLPSPVEGNDPIAHHTLISGYLNGSEYVTKIRQFIEEFRNELTNERDLGGSGVLQFTLTWDQGSGTDVDLYVDEPTGKRVFFADQIGDIGQLDVDNRQGFGPENYFVCELAVVQPGDYEIGVNYFAGSVNTTATIQVKAGGEIQTYTQLLTTPDGGNTIIPVATVNYDGENFTIKSSQP